MMKDVSNTETYRNALIGILHSGVDSVPEPMGRGYQRRNHKRPRLLIQPDPLGALCGPLTPPGVDRILGPWSAFETWRPVHSAVAVYTHCKACALRRSQSGDSPITSQLCFVSGNKSQARPFLGVGGYILGPTNFDRYFTSHFGGQAH
jgi:hypothetical protein